MQTFSSYLKQSLFDNEKGFYETEQIEEHFVTPSTLTSRYHLFLSQWIAQLEVVSVLEYGPNHGKIGSSIANYPDIRYTGVEKSEFCLKKLQENFHANEKMEFVRESSGVYDFVLLQEVLDCIPTNVFSYEHQSLFQLTLSTNRLVQMQDVTDDLAELQTYCEKIKKYRGELSQNFVFLDPAPWIQTLRKVFDQTRKYVLIIDYGELFPRYSRGLSHEIPIRGYYQHQLIQKPWLQEKMCVDLTYDVNFSVLIETWELLGGMVSYYGSLCEFLIEKLKWQDINLFSHERMLLDPRIMGSAFKVLLLEKQT